MKNFEVDMNAYPALHISEKDYEEGIIVKFVGEKPEPCERKYKALHIYLEQPNTEGKKTKRVPVIPTIPGHPNCHYGDCLGECHVVSCGIYQGYDPIPTLPDDYEPEYVEVEVKEGEE